MNQLPYLLPWLRVALLISSIRATTFDEATWPTAKTVLRGRSRCGVDSRGRVVNDARSAACGLRLAFSISHPRAPELRLLHEIR